MLTEFEDLFEDFYCNRVDEIELSLEDNEEYRGHDKKFQKALTLVRGEQGKTLEGPLRNILECLKRCISRISIKEGYKQGFNDALKIMRGF